MAKLKVSRSFVKEAHENACSTWKLRIEKEFPELFEKKEEFKAGDYLILTECSGADSAGSLIRVISRGYYARLKDNEVFSFENDWARKATIEEITKLLIKEAKKRGFKQGVSFMNLFNKKIFKSSIGLFKYLHTGELVLDDNTIYNNSGQWAEIIPTITKAEAEAKLNCKIV